MADMELRRCLGCGGRDHYPKSSALVQSCTTCECVCKHVVPTCSWCHRPATTTVEIEGPRITRIGTGDGSRVKRVVGRKFADACEGCAARVVTPMPVPPVWSGDQLGMDV